MIIMLSDHSSWRVHYLQGRFGGIARLLSADRPGRMKVWPHLEWALDNGAFPAWKNGEPWDEEVFIEALDWVKGQSIQPKWIVVPDVVTDCEGTFKAWEKWEPRLRHLRIPLALAVQDGMTAKEVELRASPDVIFVGGSRPWKLQTRRTWAETFPRVHVGRVNGLRDLVACHELGVESVDGTGFFRGRRAQLQELITYLEEIHSPDGIAPMFMPSGDGEPLLPFPHPDAGEIR